MNNAPNIPAPIRIILSALIVLLASISLAQPAPNTPISVPTSRQADRVAIITIEAPFDWKSST